MEPPAEQPFRGEVLVKALPNLAVGKITSTSNRIARTPPLVADGNDDIMLGIMLKGEAVVTQQGSGDVTVGCGEAVVWSNALVGHSTYSASIEFLSVAIPRAVLVPSLIHPDRAKLAVIPREAEGLALLTGYLQILLRETVPRDIEALSAAHVHDLVAMTLGAGREAADTAGRGGLRAARLRAIKDDIHANLGRRELTVNMLALRHAVSPRSIRELFGSENTTFTEYVLKQRLARVHRLLSDPRFADRTISSIAFDCGFGDLSYFNHAFRRHYKATPSDVRASAVE